MSKAVKKITRVKWLVREFRRHPLLFAVAALGIYYLLIMVDW